LAEDPMPAPFEAEIAGLARTLARNPASRIFAPLAEAYRRAGRIEEAIATCQAGLRHHPHFLSGQLVLARCWHDRGELDLASAGFREVLRGEPGNAVALRALGEIARERGDREEAAGWFRQALEADPGDEELRARLESLAPAPGAAPRAASVPSPAAEIATVTLAEVYLEQGLHERALSVYRRVLAADPANAGVQDRVRRLELLLADERGAFAGMDAAAGLEGADSGGGGAGLAAGAGVADVEAAAEAVPERGALRPAQAPAAASDVTGPASDAAGGDVELGSGISAADEAPDSSWAFLLEDEEDQDPEEVFAAPAAGGREPSAAEPRPAAGGAEAPRAPDASAPPAADDEDLRKFQEWLRSLG
jgi:tetratricopeptide (TPR) repeat protein